jgi:chloramphenicol-sensitive protein RarD
LTEVPTHHKEAMRRLGFATGVSAYLLWGMFPLYFHYLNGKVTPYEILAHRIIWSVPVVAILLWRRDRLASVLPAFRDRRTLAMLAISGVLIAVNWLVFVYGIAETRLIEVSLGYFINPLVSVGLGMIFLRERLTRLQYVSLALVIVGVGYLVFNTGRLPWISLVLAFSFGLYGLTRKTVAVDSATGFFMETLLLSPFALGFFIYLAATGQSAFFSSFGIGGMLALGGPLTALPLILYTTAVRLLPLSTMGFLQYIAPTLQFSLAVFAFGEKFDQVKATAFAIIWGAIAIFVFDLLRRRQPRG